MTTYQYVSLEPSGRRKTGLIDAASKEAAIAALSVDGRFVLEVAPQTGTKKLTDIGGGGRVSRSELALFTRRLSDLSAAGLPLDRVLQVISEQSESPVLVAVAHEVLEQVRTGIPVSDALSKHPKLFSKVYTQTLKAGEASGQFPDVASRLADFQEKEVTRRSQITSALVYPAVLTFVAVGVIIFMMTFVVPRLAGVFKDLGGELPAPTKALMAMSSFLTEKGLFILGAIVLGVIFYKAWVATPTGLYARDKFFLNMPGIGALIRKSAVSRYARVLATLVFGGVPILEALEISGLSCGNKVFEQNSMVVQEEVREGRPIADAMRDTGAFPPVLTHMVAIGEETGDLPKMLGRVSDSMDFEVDNGLRRLTSLLEPAMVLFMGAFVAFVVLSIILPIYQAQEMVK